MPRPIKAEVYHLQRERFKSQLQELVGIHTYGAGELEEIMTWSELQKWQTVLNKTKELIEML